MKRNKSAGFTLVEIVVVTAVIGMMIIALTNLVIAIGGIQRQSERLTLASRIAESKIESLRNNHYNNLVNSPPAIDFTSELPVDLPEPRSATVTVTEPSNGIKRLDVSISYTDGKLTKNVNLSGLIGNIGLSQ